MNRIAKFVCGKRRKKPSERTTPSPPLSGGLIADDDAAEEEILPDNKYIRVLIAEDNIVSLNIMKRMLRLRSNIVVESVCDGTRALELVTSASSRHGQDPFSLLMLDIHMPGMNGIDVIKGIRRRNIDVPILIVTADESIGTRCKRAGADAILFKPVKRAALLEIIDELICPFNLEEVIDESKPLVNKRGV